MSELDDPAESYETLVSDAHWIPLSDLMTGLMVTFLLIAVTYMLRVESESARIREVAVAYDEIKRALYHDLELEFHADLPRWKAQLDQRDLAVRFTEPDVLFATGRSELKPEFQEILSDFFPRYVRILTSPRYRASITEVRIEGHTSTRWGGAVGVDDAYFENMALSQARTRTTLRYVLALPAVAAQTDWLRRYVTANGLSSSRLVLDRDGHEDPNRSQRVEFQVRTDAETRIERILDASR